MSNKVLGPDTWGPVVWHALHYITLGYPVNPTPRNKIKYKHFFTLLSDVLPCSICAKHFEENLVNMPLDDKVLENKESLIKWLIDFHNIVNEKNNKPIIMYKEARQLIEQDKECKHKIIYKNPEPKINNPKIKIINNKTKFNFNSFYYLFGLLLLIIFFTLFSKKI
jgi:hypothetical protein